MRQHARGTGAVEVWARVESAACARRLAAMVTVLEAAYAADGSADRDQWCHDNWDAVCDQVGAAQRMSGRSVSNLLLTAVALKERFPKVAAVFAAGLLTLAPGRGGRPGQRLEVAAVEVERMQVTLPLHWVWWGETECVPDGCDR
ncbi:DUF222 domain-containing protein [Mycobacterium antarcticum]|uniref:DUF222 domain-containing protein n=1 Tax=Mycolicibacterium sp. TUM20984 TaxID=3023368 RepID=UPI00239AA2D7|nr:DUF222 domain-containing protein [Mycolicibacterium sp. TUM20984]GLP83638.1 hypothetical protein TUM20984_50580 [Mycolicibacterium sp. TUM20984]